MHSRILLNLAVLSSFTFAIDAHATPAGAGIVERDIERQYESRPFNLQQNIPNVQIDMPDERLNFPEGKSVLIQSVQISGNEAICTDEILACFNGCLNRECSIRDIYELCQKVDQYYIQAGYFLTRAYPPPQQIANGVLCINVIEGRLGNINVVGNCNYPASFIRSYFGCLKGKPIHYDQFLRALLLVNDNMDLYVGAVFQKGEEFGTGDLILNVRDDYPAHLYLNGNNYGMDLTTHTRVGSRLDWGNFFVPGDVFSIAEVVGMPIDALYFTDLIYSMPLTWNGLRLEAEYLTSRFRIDELHRLHLNGKSDIATVGLSQAMLRSRTYNIDLFTYFDYKQIQNLAGKRTASYDKLRVITLGSSIEQFSPKWGRELMTVQFAAGIPSFLGGLKPVDKLASRAGAGGRFFIIDMDFDHLQPLPYDTFFFCHASAQYSFNKLTLPELFYIGGEDTVRGYPLAVALGDTGYYFNLEYRFPPPFIGNKSFFGCAKKWKDIVQFDVFLDQGGVFLRSESKTSLCGTGIGVRIKGPYTIDFSVDVGFPLTERHLSRSAFAYFKITAQPF